MKEGNPACGDCSHSRRCDPALEPVTRKNVPVTRPNADLCRHHCCANGIKAAVGATMKHLETHTQIDHPLDFGTWDKPAGTRVVTEDGRIMSYQGGEWFYTGQQINAENIIRIANMQRNK
jgi:hypothetical protein